jgi:hypothetical protein
MTSKRRHAEHHEVLKQIDEIRALYELGCESLGWSLRISAQAEAWGCTLAWLALARRFAACYSDDQVDDLCALILEHLPTFGTSHIEILLAIPEAKREKYQSRCIKRNWSRRQLIAAKTKRFPPRSHGGRHPEVTADNAVVEYEDHANAFCRLFERTGNATNGVRKAARAQLKKTQRGG